MWIYKTCTQNRKFKWKMETTFSEHISTSYYEHGIVVLFENRIEFIIMMTKKNEAFMSTNYNNNNNKWHFFFVNCTWFILTKQKKTKKNVKRKWKCNWLISLQRIIKSKTKEKKRFVEVLIFIREKLPWKMHRRINTTVFTIYIHKCTFFL